MDVLDKKKGSSGKVIKLELKGKLASKLKMNPANSENPATLWYFTHT
jgi:hypothetical protein